MYHSGVHLQLSKGLEMTETNPPTGESPWAPIILRAMNDPDFRERLTDDPRSTIAEVTSQNIPEEIEIVIVENSPKTFHIVLPSSDLDIEALDVSGGGGYYWDPRCACESPSY